MAPSSLSTDNRFPKEKTKLRKPIVEKMRRDRINHSIEQLKVLLEKEFHKQQQPNVKLEKADILEMAVSYLQQQQKNTHHSASVESLQKDYQQGYSWCVREAFQFLRHSPEAGDAHQKLLSHLNVPPKASAFPCVSSPAESKHVLPASSPAQLWRPW